MLINVFGKNLYYERYGPQHPKTLVYLHGGPGASCLDFAAQAQTLGQQIQVISLDQWGVLRSDPIESHEPYSMAIQLNMLEDMRRQLGIERWSVLGHSYGGALAVLYAHTYPHAIDRLILDCPSLDFADSARSIAKYMSSYVHAHGDSPTRALCEKLQTCHEHGPAVVMDILTLLSRIQDPQLRNYLHSISYETYWQSLNCENITGDMWAKAETHLSKLLEKPPCTPPPVMMWDSFLPMAAQLRLPLLLLRGAYDPACTPMQADFLLQHVPDSQQIIFPNSGHFPRVEEPAAYTRSILDFLTK